MGLNIIETWYLKLSDMEKKLPLMKLDGKMYSPEQIYLEVKNKTTNGQKLQNKVESLMVGSTLDEQDVAEARLVQLLTERPVRVAALVDPAEGKEEFSSQELIERIKKKDKLGKSLLETEIKQMIATIKHK